MLPSTRQRDARGASIAALAGGVPPGNGHAIADRPRDGLGEPGGTDRKRRLRRRIKHDGAVAQAFDQFAPDARVDRRH